MSRSLPDAHASLRTPDGGAGTREAAPPRSSPATEIRRAEPAFGATARLYQTHYDATYGVYWVTLGAHAPVRFTPALLAALRHGQHEIAARVRAEIARGEEQRLRYQVFSSRIPGVFSLGGDLALFRKLIDRRDRDALLRYARECIDLVYTTAVSYELPITTINLVQGQALGGGLECALAANVVIAERRARFGLPEVLFNLFPGMGAYQLLCRRLPPARAEQLILSGRTHTAEELHDMGLIDVLVDDGAGEAAVQHYIRMHQRRQRAELALRRAVHQTTPLDYQMMLRTTEVWADAALDLGARDLELLDYLVRSQQRQSNAP